MVPAGAPADRGRRALRHRELRRLGPSCPNLEGPGKQAARFRPRFLGVDRRSGCERPARRHAGAGAGRIWPDAQDQQGHRPRSLGTGGIAAVRRGWRSRRPGARRYRQARRLCQATAGFAGRGGLDRLRRGRHRSNDAYSRARWPADRNPRPGQPDAGAVCVMSKFKPVSKSLAAIAVAVVAAPACAQPKAAQLVLADPFVVQAGKPTKLTLRGLRLEGVTAVRCHEPKSLARLLGKPGKASGVDPKLVNQIGDMQIEIEVTAAPDSVGGDISVSVVTSTGESSPFRRLVDDGSPVVAEKEPNNGFRQAQPISNPQTIAGAIQQLQDVD